MFCCWWKLCEPDHVTVDATLVEDFVDGHERDFVVLHDEQSVDDPPPFGIWRFGVVLFRFVLEDGERGLDGDFDGCGDDARFAVGWSEAIDVKLFADFVLEELHLDGLAVDEHHVFGLAVLNQLHDAFGVGVRAEAHVLDGHFDLDDLPVFELDLLGAAEDFVADGALYAVARHDDHVVFVGSPFFEDLQREASVEHSRRGEHDHRSRIVDVALVEGLYVLEVEHVALYERLTDLLVGPGDEHLIVVVGLFREPNGEVNRIFEIHPFPVSL